MTDLAAAAPQVADVHASLGTLLAEVYQAANGAEKAYRMALEKDPQFALAMNGLVLALYGQGKWTDARSYAERAAQYPDAALSRIAMQNVLTILDVQQKFYASAIPVLPQSPSRPALTVQQSSRIPATESVAVMPHHAGRGLGQIGTVYQPAVPKYPSWADIHRNYQLQLETMARQLQQQQQRFEAQWRPQTRDIGGITMNMQKALADRGDWPVGTFFTLGYEVLPPRKPPSIPLVQHGADAYRQKEDFASALAELEKTGKPLIVEVVSETATLQVGEQLGATVRRGDRLRITRVNQKWLWVESVEGRQLAEPGWIDRKHVR